MKPLAVIAAACLISFASIAAAQDPGQGDVVLIDLTYIFKHHTGLTAAKKQLKEQVSLAQTDVNIRRQQVVDMTRQLQQLAKGSPEYADMEQKLRDAQFEMTRDFDGQEREFLKRETQMLHATLKEVLDEVALYCRQSGAKVALQFNGDPVTLGDHNQILRDLSRPVLYWDKSADITPIILNQINRRSQARVPGK